MIALVTGANRGIGFQITRDLAELGYTVIATGRNQNKLNQTIGMLRAEYDTVSAQLMDITNEASIAALVADLESRGIKLDALINNAAILKDGEKDILDITEADFLNTLETNTVAPFIVTKSFLPLMNEGSRIVMMSSGAGEFCGKLSDWAPIYSLSKTALNAVTRQLAKALEPKGIMVNSVCPGWVKTDMGGSGADRSVTKGAETPVWLATEVNDTGKFWRDKQVINW